MPESQDVTREPGYRYPRRIVDKAADLIANDAGGYDEVRWRDDPRNTAQMVFDIALASLSGERLAEAEAKVRAVEGLCDLAEASDKRMQETEPEDWQDNRDHYAARYGIPPKVTVSVERVRAALSGVDLDAKSTDGGLASNSPSGEAGSETRQLPACGTEGHPAFTHDCSVAEHVARVYGGEAGS